MTTLDDEARIYFQELFKTRTPLRYRARPSAVEIIESSGRTQTTESQYRPYPNTHIAGNSRMTGKVGHPSPKVRNLGRPPHALACEPLPIPHRSSVRPPMAAFNSWVTPTPTAPSSQFTSAKSKPDHLSIDSASLERWFLTGLYADA